jgi:hypothetical protein
MGAILNQNQVTMSFRDFSAKLIQTRSAIESAKQMILDERSGEQLGLYSPWHKFNRAMLKYCRFNQVTMIAGMSGSGKSFILNMIRQAFLDYEDWAIEDSDNIYLGREVIDLYYSKKTDSYIPCNKEEGNALLFPESGLIRRNDDDYLHHRAVNRNCKFNTVLVHFGYEMSPEDELLRSASTIMGASFGYIMSSEIVEGENSSQAYNRITDSEYQTISNILDTFDNRKEYYVPISLNIQEMKKVVEYVAEVNPTAKIIITLDHTLLSKKLDEKDDMELQAAIAEVVLELRQRYGALIIILNQLNQNIERPERREKPVLHYPVKSDIHLGAQIWWACDNVFVFHRPKLLGIMEYGPEKLKTDKLIHCAAIKSRRGRTGDIFFEEDFIHGRMHERAAIDFRK